MRYWASSALLVLLLVQGASALLVSPQGGFYPGNVEVALTAAPGNTIRYTLDSTNPSGGIEVTQPLILQAPGSSPSALATNPDTAIFLFTIPTATLNAAVLRAAEIDPNGSIVAEATHTYFIGMQPSNFTTPVFSIVADPAYLDDYTIGMLIKGASYYNDLALHGGNPDNPFREANWNNDSLRWPAHMELYVSGNRDLADRIEFYPSGRWSGALAQKSFKVKYEKDWGGPSKTTYQFFENRSVAEYEKIRFRQGSQDWTDGILMRDCVSGEIIQGMHVESAHCRSVVLFLNGEYWGLYSMNEDFDDKQLAMQYGIKKGDVVLLEQDGLLEEGDDGDDMPYFALKSWLSTHDLSDPVNWAYFESQVNVESLIDYYSVHMFFNNNDFPADHRIWRNKGVAKNNTPADGRWYFEPKDRDQIAGRYEHIAYDENTVEEYLNKSATSWGHIFLVKAWENAGFRQRFINRSLELLDTNFESAHMNATIDAVAAGMRPELPRQISRWTKPHNIPWWEKEVVEFKDWLARRNIAYRGFILALNGTNATIVTNTTNVTNATQPPNATVCYTNLAQIPSSCSAGSITLDTVSGGCRLVTCTSSVGQYATKACQKSGGWFEMYPVSKTGTAPAVCIGSTCLAPNSGFAKSSSFPICTSNTTTPNATNTTPPPDSTPPVISNGQPSGSLPSGTTSTVLGVSTNENANCAYSTSSGQSYASMTPFSTTGLLSHQTPFGPLSDGSAYQAHVKCKDAQNNTNTGDFTISFSVLNAPVEPPSVTPSVTVSIAAWYPKVQPDGVHYVLVCNQNVGATSYDWYTSQNGIEVSKNLALTQNTVYKVLKIPGTYKVTCVARGNPVTNGSMMLTI